VEVNLTGKTKEHVCQQLLCFSTSIIVAVEKRDGYGVRFELLVVGKGYEKRG